MPNERENIKIFHDTEKWIKNNKKLSSAIESSKKNTKVYFEDDYPSFDSDLEYPMTVSVTKDRSFRAAMRLHKENPTVKIAVMNFANAFQPGGGVQIGANAQEECLCRTSTLYPLLNRKSLLGTFYKHHKNLRYHKENATDSLIYTPDVVICKTDEDLPVRMPDTDWVKVDVLTVAAPNLNTFFLYDFGKKSHMSDIELFNIHVKRASHMLTCAAAHKDEILVLGAFGCGAFRNNPEVVARAYKVALQNFPNVFKKIEFAVYCTPREEKNYKAFKKEFVE